MSRRKPGSIRGKVGDRVRRGDVIALLETRRRRELPGPNAVVRF